MGQRAQAALGCSTSFAGLAAGFAVWWYLRTPGRVHRFEQGPDWQVFVVDLPLCLVGGVGAGVLGGVVLHRVFRARRGGPPGP
ncbi:hypothetical protein [Streptomyces sp. SGAir0957]